MRYYHPYHSKNFVFSKTFIKVNIFQFKTDFQDLNPLRNYIISYIPLLEIWFL